MAHILNHLNTNVKIIIDAHTMEQTISNLRKDYKMDMDKYNIEGHYSKERGILILTNKSCGYEICNLGKLDQTNTLQFYLVSPGGRCTI